MNKLKSDIDREKAQPLIKEACESNDPAVDDFLGYIVQVTPSTKSEYRIFTFLWLSTLKVLALSRLDILRNHSLKDPNDI
jgi:hypothetical protein